jgi:hypothetical protein
MLDLKGLQSAGAKAKPADVKAEPTVPTPIAVVSESPAVSSVPEGTPLTTVQAAPLASAQVAVPVPTKPSFVPELPNGAEPLYTKNGVYVAIRTSDGRYITVTREQPTDSIAGLSSEDRRPIDWDEESRIEGMAQRTPGRVQFLIQHENEAQRTARIQNDLLRGLQEHSRAEKPFDPDASAAADSIRKFLQ